MRGASGTLVKCSGLEIGDYRLPKITSSESEKVKYLQIVLIAIWAN